MTSWHDVDQMPLSDHRDYMKVLSHWSLLERESVWSVWKRKKKSVGYWECEGEGKWEQ